MAKAGRKAKRAAKAIKQSKKAKGTARVSEWLERVIVGAKGLWRLNSVRSFVGSIGYITQKKMGISA